MRKLATLTGLLFTSLTGAAMASGYYVPKVGGDTAGPTTANGSALFWNPAAMTLMDGHSVFLEAQPVWRKNAYTSSEPGLGTADNTRWNVLPAAAATFTLHDRLKAGVGLFFPYGLGSDFRPIGGPQRFSIIYADMRSMFVMPSVSFDLYKTSDDRFTLAAGFVYARTTLVHYKALDTTPVLGGSAGSTVSGVDPSGEARVKFDGAANNYSFDLGLLWQRGPWRVGGSYLHSMEAQLQGTLQSYLQPSTAQTAPSLKEPMDAKVNFSLPSTARLGGEYSFADGKYTAKLQGDWSHWSEFKTQNIIVTPPPGVNLPLNQAYSRNFKDSFGLRVGGSIFVNDWLQFLISSGIDTAAVPDPGMTPEVNDAFVVGVSVGPKVYLGMGKKNYRNRRDQRTGVFMSNDTIILHAAWNPLYYQPRNVSNSTSVPSSNGHYTTVVHMIAFNVDYRF